MQTAQEQKLQVVKMGVFMKQYKFHINIQIHPFSQPVVSVPEPSALRNEQIKISPSTSSGKMFYISNVFQQPPKPRFHATTK
jgi:hypothetical protein